RLRRGDQPSRDACTLLARQPSDAEVPSGSPRQVEAARGNIVGAGEVDERRQGRTRRDLARRHQLRHLEDPDLPAGAGIDPGPGRIRGTEVDADEGAGGHAWSAGADGELELPTPPAAPR